MVRLLGRELSARKRKRRRKRLNAPAAVKDMPKNYTFIIAYPKRFVKRKNGIKTPFFRACIA